MTADDDRATLQRVLDAVKWVGPFAEKLGDDSVARHLAWFRSALSVPDAAQVKAQARREAIEIVRARILITPDAETTGPWIAVRQALRDVLEELRALAAQPAARGEMEDEQRTGSSEKSASRPIAPAREAARAVDREEEVAGSNPARCSSLRPGLLRAAEKARAYAESAYTVVTTKMNDLADALTAEAAKRTDKPEATVTREVAPRAADETPQKRSAPPAPHPHEEDTMSHENPPPLDDAAIAAMYDRGANALSAIAQDAGDTNTIAWYRAQADRLRQPPAPAPAPDVFEAFARDVLCDEFGDALTSRVGPMADRAREWFGPLVEALETIAKVKGSVVTDSLFTHVRDTAKDALAQLRARAKEAKRG